MSDSTSPNVLFVLLDEMRADALGCYGHPFIETPTIDRLAEEGACFRNTYTNSPVCSPARTSLHSSLYPHQHGITDNQFAMGERPVPSDLPEYLDFLDSLRERGYQRIENIGKYHIPIDASKIGFEESVSIGDGTGLTPWDIPDGADVEDTVRYFHDNPGYPWDKGPLLAGTHPGPEHETVSAQSAQMAIDRIESFTVADEQPWFLRLSIDRPHTPVFPPEPYATMYDDKVSLPDVRGEDLDGAETVQNMATNDIHDFTDEELLRIRSRYFGLVSYVDDQLGRVFDAIDELGYENGDVLTIFTADHGSAIGDRGLQTKSPVGTPESAKVPLVFHWPGHVEAGIEYEPLAQLLDVAPTMLELVGVDIPKHFEGESLVPALQGDPTPIHHEVFLEQGPMETVVTDEWRYSRYDGDGNELYDLVADPAEATSVVDENPDVVAELDSRLDEWLSDTPRIVES